MYRVRDCKHPVPAIYINDNKYVTIYSFLRYLWKNLQTQVVCGCMLLNKFYLSVQERLFRMETFCLFSFKGVISIYIYGWANTNLFIMEATSSQAVSFNFFPLAPTPFHRDDHLDRSPL